VRETGIDDGLVAAATKGGPCPLTNKDPCVLAPAEGGERRDREDAKPPLGEAAEAAEEHKRASPFDDGSRHFDERANICIWI